MRLVYYYYLVSFLASSRIISVTCQRVRRIDVIDPKTVVQKPDSTTSAVGENWAYPMNNENLKRPINILSLGGAVAWGATLEDRNAAYPLLVGSPNSKNVDNLASPEFGAYYYALCLESAIPDSSSKNYDVILLDFVSSEFQGLPWLLQRLRERYPDAILIYIHIWPLRALVKDNHGLQPDVIGLDQKTDWHWNHGNFSIHDFNPQIMHGAKQAVAEAGGHFVYLPFPKDPKQALEWFSPDWWHLSALGHKMIADNVLKLLSTMKDDLFKDKRLGSFGFSDQCVSWVSSGKLELPHSFAKIFKVSKHESENSFADEWQLQWESDGNTQRYAEIEFHSKLSHASPVIVAYFRERALEYSRSSAEVIVNDLPAVIINPNHFYTPFFFPDVKYAIAGEVHPGKNMIRFKNIDPNASPFGMVGLLTNGDTSRSANFLKRSEAESTISQHIVYCFMQPDPRKSKFKINLDVVEAVITATAGRLYPSWEVHVITNSDEAITRLGSHHNLRVIDYRDAPFSNRVERFKSSYIHQSVNDVEYEKFCMYRWIVIHEYFAYLQSRGVPVSFVLAADSDLVIVSDPFLVDLKADWKGIESYMIVDGGLIMWSLQGLKYFSDFLLDVYKSKGNALMMVVEHGDTCDVCKENLSLLIPCIIKDSKPAMYHTSDMWWYVAFSGKNPESRVRNRKFSDCGVIGIWSGNKYRFTRDGREIMCNSEHLCVVHFNNIAKPFAIPFHHFLVGAEPEYVIDNF